MQSHSLAHRKRMKRRLESSIPADFFHSSLGVHIYKYGDDLLQTHRRKRERERKQERVCVKEQDRKRSNASSRRSMTRRGVRGNSKENNYTTVLLTDS